MLANLSRWRSSRRRSPQTEARPSVAFLMEYVPAYRAPIYEHLAPLLEAEGIELILCVGTPPPSRSARQDALVPANAVFNRNRFVSVRGRELTFQWLPRAATTADLVVVQQEAGLVINYLLAARSVLGRRFAVWGHGEDPNAITRSDGVERLKRVVTRRAHWAFAYTDRSRQIFESIGVPADRVTVTNNSMSIDTSFDPRDVDPELRELVAEVERRSRRIGWFVSSMDEGKRLPDLMKIVDQVRNEIHDFEFFFVGEGGARPEVTEFCRDRPWAHDVGARRDAEKAAIGSVARLMIMPSAVGLHVLDAFAFGSPLITATDPSNSHELDYLDDDVNGVLLRHGAANEDFALAAVGLLNDEVRHDAMCEAAQHSAEEFSIEAMTARFAAGIALALRPETRTRTSESARG
ncbi:MAG: glycosyltransferase family 4 protein [Acidimicrobiales bacterium]